MRRFEVVALARPIEDEEGGEGRDNQEEGGHDENCPAAKSLILFGLRATENHGGRG